MSRQNVKTILYGAAARPRSCSLVRSPACRAYSPSAVFFKQDDPEAPGDFNMRTMYNRAMQFGEAGQYLYRQFLQSVDHHVQQEARDRVQKIRSLVEEQQKVTRELNRDVQVLPEIPAYHFDYHRRRKTLDGAYFEFFKTAESLDLHLEDLQRIRFPAGDTEFRRRRTRGMTPHSIREWAEDVRREVKASQKRLQDALDDYNLLLEAQKTAHIEPDANRADGAAIREETTPEEAEKNRKTLEARKEALREASQQVQLKERDDAEKRRLEKIAKAAEERAQEEREAVFNDVANDTAQAVFRKTVGFSSYETPVATVPDVQSSDAQPDERPTTELFDDDAPTVGWGAAAPFRRPTSERNRRIFNPRFSAGSGGRRVRRLQSAGQKNNRSKTSWGSGFDRLGSGEELP